MTVLTLPPTEEACVHDHYGRAGVILEYGSGGSTVLGASLPNKLVFSVESDRDWAVRLQAEIDKANPPSSAILWYVDIGPTGAWGRPLHDQAWQRFHNYPFSIWDQTFFRHPDVVLIDGRFRQACFAAVCLKITRPVTVLFDDYLNRERYHRVEILARPLEMAGRMAVFYLQPGLITGEYMTSVFDMFTDVTYASQGSTDYREPRATARKVGPLEVCSCNRSR